jgi:hypothetical protein
VDEVRIHPETLAGDPFPAAAAEQDQDDHPCCCLEGWVFIPSRTSTARREKPPIAAGVV